MLPAAPRWAVISLAAIAAGGLLLRLIPLVLPGGPLAAPTGYDDGVYFAASALLFDGVLPYRDFVFVHPPGVLYVFAIVSWVAQIDPAVAFAAARVLAAAVGAINIALAGAVVMRATGPLGGLVAAGLYAIHPDAVVAEHSPYLEPVLNLACLALALVWLRQDGDSRRPLVAGVLAAAACAMKVLGGIWLIAAIASAPAHRFRKDVARLIGAAAVAGLLLVLPLALTNVSGFVLQTLMFHSWRPPDGVMPAVARIPQMLGGVYLVPSLLAAIALIAIVVRRRATLDERFFAVAAVLTFAAFLASSSYWNHYNSHLAASQCALAGFGAAALANAGGSRRGVRWLVALLVVLFSLPAGRQTFQRTLARSPEQLAAGRAIRSVVPPGNCVFAFDPTWTLIGARLPPHADGAPVVVDSYGAMLLPAVDGARYPDTATAFQSAPVNRDVLARLQACRYAIIDWRARWQMNDAMRQWVAARYLCITPDAGDLCVSERLDVPFSGLTLTPTGNIEFGEGWFGEEGQRPNSWRWMASRSVATLPPIDGPAELGLVFHVPVEQLGGAPSVTVELDGTTIDRFVPSSSEVTRVYRGITAHTSGRVAVLVVSSDRAFNPARQGGSPDQRDLSLSLKRIIWRPHR